MNKIPPFSVGQEVVCVRGHRQSGIKEGQTFIVKGITKKCCSWIVDVGMVTHCFSWVCSKCKHTEINDSKIGWLASDRFAPKDQFKAVSFTKVMETETVSEN